MPKYSLSDIPVIESYGRKETFEAFFGDCIPDRENLFLRTFEQMLIMGAGSVSFHSAGHWNIFSADNPWITADDLKHMLSGKFLSVPNRNDNLLRIETIYRFLFKDVALVRRGSVEFVKGEPDKGFDTVSIETVSFGLILGSYSHDNWTETRKYRKL